MMMEKVAQISLGALFEKKLSIIKREILTLSTRTPAKT